MIKLDLWEVINTRHIPEREIPESLEKPEKPVGNEPKASKAEDGRNGPETDPSKSGD